MSYQPVNLYYLYTASKVNIVSTPLAEGFKTTIDSYIEYNVSSGAYVSERHEAFLFDVDIWYFIIKSSHKDKQNHKKCKF